MVGGRGARRGGRPRKADTDQRSVTATAWLTPADAAVIRRAAENRGESVCRLGANQSTRLMTEADLMFGDQRLPAGEYSMFAELSESEWTLIFSTYGVKQSFREDTPDTLWGSYGYTPDRDVLRTSMRVSSHPVSADQLTIMFTDMTQQGGNLTVWWDDQIASAAFTVAP